MAFWSDFVLNILGSTVVSIPACHTGYRGSIPRRGGLVIFFTMNNFSVFAFFTYLRTLGQFCEIKQAL